MTSIKVRPKLVVRTECGHGNINCDEWFLNEERHVQTACRGGTETELTGDDLRTVVHRVGMEFQKTQDWTPPKFVAIVSHYLVQVAKDKEINLRRK